MCDPFKVATRFSEQLLMFVALLHVEVHRDFLFVTAEHIPNVFNAKVLETMEVIIEFLFLACLFPVLTHVAHLQPLTIIYRFCYQGRGILTA